MKNTLIIIFLNAFLVHFVQGQLPDVLANQDGGAVSTSTDAIVLGELLAFPGAFGEGAYIQGGRGGAIYEVTSKSTGTGAGTFRGALEAHGSRIILIKVDGTVDYEFGIIEDIPADFTIIGQTAPGDGLQIKGLRILNVGKNGAFLDNFIMRHFTSRFGDGGTPSVEDILETQVIDKGFYVDHLSMSYAQDEIFTTYSRKLANYGIPIDGLERGTLANSLIAQAHPDHNTGHIFASQTDTDITLPVGNYTYARNVIHLISHRFPNFSGHSGYLESYNNIISSWNYQLSRVNGNVKVDWHSNLAIQGNLTPNPNATNKWLYANRTFENEVSIYTTGNIIEGFNTSVAQNPQKDLWRYYFSNDGTTKNNVLVDSLFITTRQSSAKFAPGGLLTANQLKDSLLTHVGHTRSAGTDGLGTDVRDSLDEKYVDEVTKENGPSSYPDPSTWYIPTKNSALIWADTDSDHIADNFEDLVGLDKNSAADATTKPDFVVLHGMTFDNRERTGGSYDANGNYLGGSLTGNNLYTWQEIYWSYLANDFLNLKNGIYRR